MNESLGHLPNEPIDRFTKPFLRFLRIEATAGAALLLAIMLALVISNSPWANSFTHFAGLMTLFFFLVALELKTRDRTWRAPQSACGRALDRRRARRDARARRHGVVVVSFLAVRLGVATKPASLDWGLIAAGGALTGIGFTMAVFIAELAFDDALLNSAKIGILAASVVAAAIGLLALAWLTSRSAMRGAPEVERAPAHRPP